MTATSFPDQIHLDRLRERLWYRRGTGRAAVMVGAGFSRNAEPLSPREPKFPLWWTVGDRLFDSLHPRGSVPEEERARLKVRSTAGQGPMRLATEYQAGFGRPALEALLTDAIPDARFTPGPLHRLLLSLPWSDVFTTNYDTLLERAAVEVPGRRYDPVYVAADLAAAVRPRIVKLHGSFPSHRPFVMTEEEFRTYPQRFAAFVNLVQQAIMENAFCLLGFSGDDPNFLAWSGWVRDNLGPAMPNIYLCGLLDLTPPQRKLLGERHVTPIDLSPVFPPDGGDTDAWHARALSWFLSRLAEGKPPNPLAWPSHEQDLSFASDFMPAHAAEPDAVRRPLQSLVGPRTGEQLDSAKLEWLRNHWREQRERDPGWVLLPKRNRSNLWALTRSWIRPLLDAIPSLGAADDLLTFYELLWRLDRCLVPLGSEICRRVGEVVDQYNPFPTELRDLPAARRPDADPFRSLRWGDLREAWFRLTLWLHRDARRGCDRPRLDGLAGRLTRIVGLHPVWEADWLYEDALARLNRLDFEGTRQAVSGWSPPPALPFAAIRKAAVLAELGASGEAEATVRRAVTELRRRAPRDLDDFRALSQEGCALLLIGRLAVRDISPGARNELQSLRHRRDELAAFRCDPRPELESVAARLELPDRTAGPAAAHRRDTFDPFKSVVGREMRFQSVDESLLDAYAQLQMAEDCAVPLSFLFLDYKSAVQGCVERLRRDELPLAVATLVRSNTDRSAEAADLVLDRLDVAAMSQVDVDRLFGTMLPAAHQAIRTLEASPAGDAAALMRGRCGVLLEVLSRLAFRQPVGGLNELLDLAARADRSLLGPTGHVLHGAIDNLFGRVVGAWPAEAMWSLVTRLLKSPLPSSGEADSFRLDLHAADPLLSVSPPPGAKPSPEEVNQWRQPVQGLVRRAREGSAIERTFAVQRLHWMHAHGLLSQQVAASYAAAVWSRVSRDTGLPVETGMLSHFALQLPGSRQTVAEKLLRRHFTSAPLWRQASVSVGPDGKEAVSRTIGHSPHLGILMAATRSPLSDDDASGSRRIRWTAKEARALLGLVKDWWKEEGHAIRILAARRKEDVGEFSRHVSDVVEVLGKVIVPNLRGAGALRSVRTLLDEIEAAGFDMSAVGPSLLFLDPSLRDEAAQRLRAGLVSTDPDVLQAAAESLYGWHVAARHAGLVPPPDDLVDELARMIASRRQPGCYEAMAIVLKLLRVDRAFLTPARRESVATGLRYLREELAIHPRGSAASVPSTFSRGEIPRHRVLACRLARRMRICLTAAGLGIPETVESWSAACEDDRLPEVRQAKEEDRVLRPAGQTSGRRRQERPGRGRPGRKRSRTDRPQRQGSGPKSETSN